MTRAAAAGEGDRDRRFKIEDAASYDPVADSFAAVAERYSAPLAARMGALAGLADDAEVLDVGCGTGVLAGAVLGRLGPRGRLVGVDLSIGMLAGARRGLRSPGEAAVRLVRADAEALPFADRSVDAVVSLFALLHFPAPAQALAEMYRVLRTGGRVVVGIGSAPSRRSPVGWLDGVRRLRALVERRVGLRAEAPTLLDALVDRHLESSERRTETAFARGTRQRAPRLRKLLESSAFRVEKMAWHGREAEIATAEAFWTLQTTLSSRSRKRLSTASPEDVATVRRAFDTACQRVQGRGGRLVYPYAALIAVGRREG